jgi:uncharacterized OsmC-like protein
MSRTEDIKTAVERSIKAVTLRPTVGRGKETMTVVTSADGLCTMTDGDDWITVDMPKEYGGGGTTPGPGFFVRTALGSCLSLGYLMWAAHLGVPINQVRMEIETEYDLRGEYGIDDDVTCAYTVVRVVVEVDSPAPRAEIERVIETTERRSFMHAIFAEQHEVERELRITSSAAA